MHRRALDGPDAWHVNCVEPTASSTVFCMNALKERRSLNALIYFVNGTELSFPLVILKPIVHMDIWKRVQIWTIRTTILFGASGGQQSSGKAATIGPFWTRPVLTSDLKVVLPSPRRTALKWRTAPRISGAPSPEIFHHINAIYIKAVSTNIWISPKRSAKITFLLTKSMYYIANKWYLQILIGTPIFLIKFLKVNIFVFLYSSCFLLLPKGCDSAHELYPQKMEMVSMLQLYCMVNIVKNRTDFPSGK